MATGENEKEALTLEKVLFTVLKASPADLASLKKTRKRNNTGIMSLFYDMPNTQTAKPIKALPRTYNSGSGSFITGDSSPRTGMGAAG